MIYFMILSLFISVLAGCTEKKRKLIRPRTNVLATQAMRAPEQHKVVYSSAAQRRRAHIRKLKEREHRIDAALQNFKDMDFQQLRQAKNVLIQEHDIDTAVQYLERMVVTGDDLKELESLRLELADLYFEQGELEKAESRYTEFITLYPSSSQREYASYKAILSCFYQTLSSDRDQTKTKDVVKLARGFIQTKDFTHYMNDVTAITQLCQLKLFEHEVGIIEFYMHSRKLTAAEHRLIAVRDAYGHLQQTEPLLLNLESQIALKRGNNELYQEKQAALAAYQQAQLTTRDLKEHAVKELLLAQGQTLRPLSHAAYASMF